MEKKRSKTEVVDCELILPEPIIHHIQSFLTGKEAAKTTVLSQSWYRAWLTRPNLEFDRRLVPREFAQKTMKRYQQLNLKIDSFKLCAYPLSSESNQLILDAMKLEPVDLHLETSSPTFALPHRVLHSENLLKLSLTDCKIDAKGKWPMLVSLSLFRVHIEGDIIWDIILSCPLIEKLVLSECKYLLRSQSTRMLVLNHGLNSLYEFRKLKCMFLKEVNVSSSFFSDFSLKFPFLKDLTVHHCFGFKQLHIYSPSLECITFAHKRILRAKFDVPSLRKFSFSGSNLPSLSFASASRECKFEISITWKRFRTSLLLKLNKFLGDFSQSISSLTLIFGFVLSECFDFPEDVGLPKHVVENLTMKAVSPASSALLDGLFRILHPKSISQYWMPMPCTKAKLNNNLLELLRKTPKENNELLELLCKTLIQEESEDCCIPNRNTLALHDLEKVSIDVFEDSLGKFQPLPWKMLLDASAGPEKRRRILFNLQWRIGASTTK